MKKALLIQIILLFMSVFSYSQVVLVNSPASIKGSYPVFGIANFGPALTSNVWTGDCVLVKDASSNPPSLGCDSVMQNAAAIKGKIALIDRANCNFSLKVHNAQVAGAIAVVIFNNIAGGGVLTMASAAYGADDTIPAVMLPYEDGVTIKAELAKGPVNMTLGNFRFTNDIATNNRKAICHAPFGTYPLSWLRNPGDFVINPGASVTNRGINQSTGVKVNAKMSYTPNGGSATDFYDKTSDPGITVEVDSTQRVLLESRDFNAIANAAGKGSITYTINGDSTEAAESIKDNTAVSEFYVSNNLFSKARLAANGRDPFVTSNYARSDGTNSEYITAFRIPYCNGCTIDSVLFSMGVITPNTLANTSPIAGIWQWDDLNGDGDASVDELTILSIDAVQFSNTDTRTSAIVRVPTHDWNTGDPGVKIASDNLAVIVGVSYMDSNGPYPYFGFDEGIDYDCDNTIRTNNLTLQFDNLPYLGITADVNGVPDVDASRFRFTGLTAPLAVSMVLSGSQFNVSNNELTEQQAHLKLFPNPVRDKYINASISLDEVSSKIIYSILDNTGKIIFQQSDKFASKEYKVKFDIHNLDNGLYHLLIKTDKGFKQASFEVIK